MCPRLLGPLGMQWVTGAMHVQRVFSKQCLQFASFTISKMQRWTQNVSEHNQTYFVSRTQNLCLQQMLRARANRETFVSATMCPQQCVLVCQGLYPIYDQNLRYSLPYL